MGYEVNGVRYDYDSPVNNHIVDMIVNREVWCCVTSEMEYMVQCIQDEVHSDDAPFTEEEVYEAIFCKKCCPECGDCAGFDELTVSDLKDSDFKHDAVIYDEEDGWREGYSCPACGCGYDTIEEARECCPDETVYKCYDCGEVLSEDDYNNIDLEPWEVFEWWLVDPMLGDDLKKHGEVVLDGWGKSYWGRCTTGQSVSADWVFTEIARDHGWLEGQPNQWHV